MINVKITDKAKNLAINGIVCIKNDFTKTIIYKMNFFDLTVIKDKNMNKLLYNLQIK